MQSDFCSRSRTNGGPIPAEAGTQCRVFTSAGMTEGSGQPIEPRLPCGGMTISRYEATCSLSLGTGRSSCSRYARNFAQYLLAVVSHTRSRNAQ